MSYTKLHTPWVDDVTVIEATDMDHIEQGIADAHTLADTAQTAASAAQTTADGKAAAVHTHAESDVTGLVADLAGKAASSHTHNASDINAGTVATARLGSGSASSSTFLRGDQTWATPSGGGTGKRVPKVNSYIGPDRIIGSAGGGSAFASGNVPFVEINVGSAISIDQLGFRVSTAEAVNAKVLLYSSDSDGYPSTLVKDSGAIDCTAGGDLLATFANLSLPAGRYWATIRSNSGTTLRFLCCTQTPSSTISTSTSNIWQAINYLQADPGTYASPNATISSWSDNNTGGAHTFMPIIFMRRSV